MDKKLVLNKNTIKSIKLKSNVKTGAGINLSVEGGGQIAFATGDCAVALTTKCPKNDGGGGTVLVA